MPKNLHNAVEWFEIPVTDIDRAQRFYEAALGGDEKSPQTYQRAWRHVDGAWTVGVDLTSAPRGQKKK